MSAVDAVDTQRAKSPSRRAANPSVTADFAWRVLVLLNLFRLSVGAVLLAIFYLVDSPRIVGETNSELAWWALIGLLAAGCAFLILLHQRTPGTRWQTYWQFATDLVAVALLIHASGGISSGLGGILIVSVGTLALLLPTERALLLAAVAALVLLGQQTYAQLQGITTVAQFAPVGILGAVIFVITSVVQLLRTRLVETEALAEQRGIDLRNHFELNDYIIQHLRESIVVVDGENQVRLINESAVKQLAAAARSDETNLATISPDLAAELRRWRSGNNVERAQMTFSSPEGTSIQPHFAPLGSERDGGVVIFLEDTSLIAERVQQAKLAALGRLSASIAHEIRNPLGAMSHAGQLLAESPGMGKDEHRLTDIIRVNARRVSQIVESVLALSRREATRPESLQLVPWAEDFTREFVQTLELYEGAVALVPGAEADLEVRMDPTHLHQILWNLCDNAVKYASAAAGAIAVELTCGVLESSGRPYLEIADRGPGIKPDKVEQIFEPFYTSQPGGTGLGLYISRELAERNGAALRYQPRAGGGSVFRIVFADPKRWHSSEDSL
ncbi:MAG TPA: HAMP domain-containing sensor histidine kinase, partial [Gammaproteobacteria bacterium]|nr:HAMP domain-containing sensor histidine kinase [Gammaproteobacteria bacterium]